MVIEVVVVDWRLIDAIKVDTTRDLLEVVVEQLVVEQLEDVAAGPCTFLADWRCCQRVSSV